MKVLVYQQGEELHRVIPNYSQGFTVESIKGEHPQEAIEVENDSMPSPYLRNSWKLENGSVTIDLPKAKNIAHDIRREKRDEYMADNLALIQKSAAGIPLGQNEKTVQQAQSENQIYKSTIDDPMQISIDAAINENELLTALGL
jgi:hypothetical protein